jgi:hypothetical protein
MLLWFGQAIILITALQVPSSAILHSASERPLRGVRLHNPFCAVPTYINHTIGTQGLALYEADGRGVIYIGREEAFGNRAYRDFLMAHECCHHTRGHLKRLKEMTHENALLALSFVSRGAELDADCCGAVALARSGRMDAVHEAARRMRTFGAMPTGAGGYPSGDTRAMLIEDCAASVK